MSIAPLSIKKISKINKRIRKKNRFTKGSNRQEKISINKGNNQHKIDPPE
jgi:hypothetical protein